MRFHFYDKTTGVLHPNSVHTNVENSERALEFARANAPFDHLEIAGEYDHLCQRVNVETGAVVDYQPPAPSENHEWDESSKRWRLIAAVAAQEATRSSAFAQINALELQQPRILRELALGQDGARARLQSIDDQIAELRLSLK